MTTPIFSKANDVIKITNPKFVFEHEGNEIVWVLQLLTGIKTIYVNGELKQRNYSVWCRSAHHTLEIDGKTYDLGIRQDSSETFDFKEINAPLVASLSVDDTPIENRRYVINRSDVTKHMIYSVMLGAICGFSVSYFT